MGGRRGFVRELFPRHLGPFPSHVNTRGSMIRFSRAFQIALTSLPHLKGIDRSAAQKVLTDKRRKSICEEYWFDRNISNRPYLADAKPHAKKVASALRQLIGTLDNGDQFANTAIVRIGESTLSTDDRAELLEDWLLACEEIVDTPSNAGRRANQHIDNALRRISILWHDLTGREFPRTITTCMGDGGMEFVAPGPQFALMLIQAVDPTITLADVKTALRKNHWKQPVQE